MRKYLLAILLAFPAITFAQNIKLTNPAGGLGDDGWGLIHMIITILKWVVIPAIAFIIIYSGFQMATAQGDVKKIDGAKKKLLGAIIGAAVLFSADMIVNVVRQTGENLL